MILYPFAIIRILSSNPLDTVAAALSKNLFNGVPFSGRELALCDEVPAVRLEGNYLGLSVVLHGMDGEYILSLRPRPSALRNLESGIPTDVSAYLAHLVRGVGFQVQIPKA